MDKDFNSKNDDRYFIKFDNEIFEKELDAFDISMFCLMLRRHVLNRNNLHIHIKDILNYFELNGRTSNYDKIYDSIERLSINKIIDEYVLNKESGCSMGISLVSYPNQNFTILHDEYMDKIFESGSNNKYNLLLTYLLIIKNIRRSNINIENEFINCCYVSIRKIEDISKISRSSIKRHIDKLEELGILISDNAGMVKSNGNIIYDSNYYALPEHKEFLDKAIEKRIKEINK